MKKDAVFPAALPKPVMSYSPVVKAGPFLFLSNHLASDYQTGIAAEARVDPDFPFHTSAAEQQLTFIAKNVEVPAVSTTVRMASPLLVPGCQFAFDIIALVPDGDAR